MFCTVRCTLTHDSKVGYTGASYVLARRTIDVDVIGIFVVGTVLSTSSDWTVYRSSFAPTMLTTLTHDIDVVDILVLFAKLRKFAFHAIG
jgi:hypothetical protein